MSDSNRDSFLYIKDMIVFSQKCLTYTSGMTQAEFVANELVYDATLRNLELIGEAATKVPEALRLAGPEIPWRMIVATRNRVAHAYLGIDDDTIWSIITEDLNPLVANLTNLLAAK